MRALEAALNAIWAMESGHLDTLISIAARENEITPEALEAYRAKQLAGTEQATSRDGVAIINLTGPLFKRGNLFTAMSGATSYDIIRRDFQAALDNPAVKAIMLNIDSPGGEASGTAELASAIYAARGAKPITAYVNGMGASAAYWIASSADKIIVDPTALLGSIGVQMAMREPAPKAGEKTYTFISSQSPMKNADPGTEDGAAGIQTVVDAMASVFVADVARNRAVNTETVLKDFGKGGIFVGKDAVQAGLADALGNYEDVLAELSTGRTAAALAPTPRSKGPMMSETIEKPEVKVEAAAPAATPAVTSTDVEALVKKAQADERTRIAGLNKFGASFDIDQAAVNAAIEDGSTLAEFSVKASELAMAKKQAAGAAQLDALKKDETVAGKVETSTSEATDTESAAEKLAQDIVASAKLAAGEQ